MKIRNEQMAAFDAQAEERFVDRMLKYLREKQTVWVADYPDPVLRKRIRSGIGRARSHGLTWESSIAKFVGLMFRYAPNFDQYPPMRAVLGRRDVPSEDRSDLLFDQITPEQWEAAEARYDPAAWEEFEE